MYCIVMLVIISYLLFLSLSSLRLRCLLRLSEERCLLRLSGDLCLDDLCLSLRSGDCAIILLIEKKSIGFSRLFKWLLL